jgi:hypothetical protein
MDDFDATIAVLAHGLLGSLAAISMALTALRENELSPDQRDSFLDVACRQTDHVSGVLRDLIAGVPPEVTNALNVLSIRGDVGMARGELLG